MATRTDSATTGTLTIGDQWNAITIIAHSQTHPLKAICELTENAIDAGARSVRIVRRRRGGEAYLEFEDDGRGVAADAAGRPDFERIATHLCDSMKRRLVAEDRRGVHGEFGIGLLSFWSLGEELRMTSAGSDGRASELRLVRGRREYEIRPVAGLLAASGTRVVVGPLLEATRNLVTGEKIARYLSAELRDRIRRSGVDLRVIDRLTRATRATPGGQAARGEIVVTPREFDGERLEIPRRYPTPLGDVQVEVYVRSEGAAAGGGISLCKDGTRVLPRIAELLPFQESPWTDGRLEGIVDFEPLALAPGTRNGVVADAALEALVEAATRIAPDIEQALAERDEAETEARSEADEADAPGAASLFAAEPGPLAGVRITPRQPRRGPGGEVRLAAVARDEQGVALTADVSLHWRLVAGTAWLTADGSACRVRSDAVGLATVEVVARQGETEVADTVEVKFVTGDEAAAGDRRSRGLPSYRLAAEPGRPWRSRYETAGNEIVINSAHRDFVSSRSSPARHRRYIGKLYAKEVVLSNFPHESPAEALERFVELTLRTDDAL
jgi:hypothetical protein